MKKTLITLAALISMSAFAQQNLNGQLEQQSNSNAAIYPGAVGLTINNSGQSNGQGSKDELKTVPSVMPPTVTNSSGNYTCFGGASGGVGIMGFGVSGGTTVGQTECYRLHLMDKARQANLPQVYAALFCQFPEGREAFEAANIDCPVAPHPTDGTIVV